MFKITDAKGFHMTFENGITISVQFGWGNYCQNYRNDEIAPHKFILKGEQIPINIESETAEVGVWDKEGNWITDKFTDKHDGTVAGHLSVTEVFEIMSKIKEHKGGLN